MRHGTIEEVIRREARAVAEAAAAASIRALRADPGLPKPLPGLRLHVGCDWDARREASHGGVWPWGYGLDLAMRGCFPPDHVSITTPHLFQEYPHYRTDPVIGAMMGDWQAHVRALVAHETAHAHQFYVRDHIPPANRIGLRGLDLGTPHGEAWQRIYRCMRPAALASRRPAPLIPERQGEGTQTDVLV
jgi:hypothetical protein